MQLSAIEAHLRLVGSQTLDMSATNSIGAIVFQNEKTSLGSVLFSFKFFYVVPNIP